MNNKLIIYLGACFIYTSLDGTYLTISQPGNYTIGEDVLYTPAGTDSIIQINANNVVLDLGNHLIAQSGGTGTLYGVSVASGLSNVTIKNGTIQNTSGAGIYINNGCRELTLQNIQTLTTNQGIILNGTSSSIISNCKISNFSAQYTTNQALLVNNASLVSLTNISVDSCATTTFALQFQGGTLRTVSLDTITIKNSGLGIQILSYDDVLLSHCRIFNCSFSGDFKGFFISAASSNINQAILIKQCSVDSCSATGSLSGFEVTNTYNSTIRSSTVSNCTGTTSTVRGFLLSQCQNIVLQSCAAKALSCSAGTPFCSGFEAQSSSRLRLQQCETLNAGQGTSYAAFYFNATTQSSLESCIANSPSTGTNSSLADGYSINSSTDIFLRNSTASNFNNNGFTLASGATRLVLRGCNTLNCANGYVSGANQITLFGCTGNGNSTGTGITHTGSGGLFSECVVSSFSNGFNINTTSSNYVEKCTATNGSGTGFQVAAASLTRFYNNTASTMGTSYGAGISPTRTLGTSPVMGTNISGV